MAEAADKNGGASQRPIKRRRQSYSEEPALMREISGFTPEPMEVFNSDDEGEVFGKVDLEDLPKDVDNAEMKVDLNGINDEEDSLSDMEEVEGIVIRCVGFQQVFPKESRKFIGLLETALSGDDSVKQLDCGKKCTAVALELTHVFVTHRLENELRPFSYKVPNLPCQTLRIADRFDLEMLRDLSGEQILELAMCLDYLQVDALLNAVHNQITIKLSNCSQEQIVTFLKTARWPEFPEKVTKKEADKEGDHENVDDLEEENQKLTPDDVIAALDDSEKLELVPNDSITEVDLDAILLRSGPISNAISMLRDKAIITPHPFIMKMPILFWGKIADRSSAFKKLVISKTQAALSGVFAASVESAEESNELLKVVVSECNSVVLRKIVDYLHHHNGEEPAEIAKPIRSVLMKNVVEDQWDAEFVDNMGKKDLFSVTKSASSLGIQSLLHLCCAKVASMIKGKSPDEIRRILGDEN